MLETIKFIFSSINLPIKIFGETCSAQLFDLHAAAKRLVAGF
jgi:hypothetical protein